MHLVVPDAGGTSKEFVQAVLALHLATPLNPGPICLLITITVTWSNLGPSVEGISC